MFYTHMIRIAGLLLFGLCVTACTTRPTYEIPVQAVPGPLPTDFAGYWERGESIPWLRVHQVPEHVQFAHQSHVRAEILCQDCHGPVETLNRLYLVPDTKYNSSSAWLPAAKLEMGWCMDCHLQKQGTRNCVSCHY